MAIEIVDLPIKKMVMFHSYVNVYQRTTLQSKLLKILHLLRWFFSLDDTSCGNIPLYSHSHIPINIESWKISPWLYILSLLISNYITNNIHMISPVKSLLDLFNVESRGPIRARFGPGPCQSDPTSGSAGEPSERWLQRWVQSMDWFSREHLNRKPSPD